MCDNKSYIVTFIKVKGAEEILGGYNPLGWDSSRSWGVTKDSFIFSFKSKNKFFKDAILSKVADADKAIVKDSRVGPCFGHDLIMGTMNNKPTTNYDIICYRKDYYEKIIRNTEGEFYIEDYEVFQVI